MKILLMGYIGQANFGDDLLFKMAIDNCKTIEDVKISIAVIGDKQKYEYLYSYFPDLIILKFDRKLPLFLFGKFDKVYYIGGGIFFDYKKQLSTFSFLKNYVSNTIRFKLTQFRGTQFGGIGLGVGPYFNRRSMLLHKQILKSFKILGVRDLESVRLVKSMGIKNVELSNDLSIGLTKYEKIKSKVANEVIICPRLYKHHPEYNIHVDRLIEFAKKIESEGYKTHWIFLQREEDILSEKLTENFKITIWNPVLMTIDDFFTLFKKAKIVFTSRMHSAFISGLVNIPFVVIRLHQKLEYASNLFYNNPVILEPTIELEAYQEAFDKLSNLKMEDERLIAERLKLRELNNRLLNWLNSR